ncbi:hypothetical protein KC19_VG152600 [Ceratodon purpureus]|uniref:Uncharacterized protein n=1 Tax=Ceratodon purpureus TaxID=3225 RepID=A0A8T0HQU1_CERPU|nr:hypothetical protein KC19_VG152600 [Ceratodon purpureus]
MPRTLHYPTAMDKEGGITSAGGMEEETAKSTSHSTQTSGTSRRAISPPPAVDDSVKAEDSVLVPRTHIRAGQRRGSPQLRLL